MRMTFKCGHKGLGASCHRCAEAQRMEDIANGLKKPAEANRRKKDKGPAFDGWNKEKFLAEAKRLRMTKQELRDLNKVEDKVIEEVAS
jgi:hypothetical protein